MKIRNLLFVFALCSPLCGFSQKLTSYKATNGVTYHVDDTVHLGKGSNANGSFMYIEDRGPGLPAPMGRTGGSHSLPRDFANTGVVIKSIRKTQINGVDKYLFMVSAGGLFRLSMYIDDAIAACEVKPCTTVNTATSTGTGSVADEIKKLKDLLDSGAITKDEYDKQKKKLLGD